MSQTETITDITTNQNAELWIPVPIQCSTIPISKVQGLLQKRKEKDYKSQRIRLDLLEKAKAILIKSHLYDCLTMSYTTITIDI